MYSILKEFSLNLRKRLLEMKGFHVALLLEFLYDRRYKCCWFWYDGIMIITEAMLFFITNNRVLLVIH